MTDSDIVAELRRLYEAAIQHAGDLDETASVLALNIAVVHHLPALLDVVEAAEGYRDYSIHSIEGMEYERRLDAALDALYQERSRR